MTNKKEPCVCKEPTCSSRKRDTGCAFEPAHEQGTTSHDPLQAMIEASEELLVHLADAEEDMSTDGRLRPDIRRLYATIAYAKHQQQRNGVRIEHHQDSTAWMPLDAEPLSALPAFVAEMVRDLSAGAEENKGQYWHLRTQRYDDDALDELPIDDNSVCEIALTTPMWLRRSSTGRFSLSPLPLGANVSSADTTLAWIVQREAVGEQGITVWQIVLATREDESENGSAPAEEGLQHDTNGVYRVDLKYTRLATLYVLAGNKQIAEHAARVLNRTYDITSYKAGEYTEHTVNRVTGPEAEVALADCELAEGLGEYEDKEFEKQVYEMAFGPLPDFTDGAKDEEEAGKEHDRTSDENMKLDTHRIHEAAVPCIFWQPDENEPTRGTWVRIMPSHYGMTICIFKDQPDTNTPEWQALGQAHIDACFMNKVRVQLYHQRGDPDRDDQQDIVLVEDVDAAQPRRDGEER